MPKDNNTELKQGIEDLKNELNSLKSHIDGQDKVIAEHQHTGADGSFKITDADIMLKERHAILSGPGGMVGVAHEGVDQKDLIFAVGPESPSSGVVGLQSKNAQLTVQYNPPISAIFGLSDVVAVEKTSIPITSSQTNFNDRATDFGDTNSKVGYYLTIWTLTDVRGYKIASNTKYNLILDNAFGIDDTVLGYVVYKPLYIGTGLFQFQRLHILEGTGGGIKFGPGNPFNGQNALLFMDSAGALKYKKLNGDEEIIVAA